MDALTQKGFRDFMATGVRPVAAAVVVEEKPDPMFYLLTSLCVVGMLAKDFHYRAKGKAFYALHLLADLVYDATHLFDEINEVYYMGECASVPPLMASVSAKAAEMAAKDRCGNGDTPVDEDACIPAALIARCKATAGAVEECKSLAPKSGTAAVLDEISKKMLTASGLLARTEQTPGASV